MILAAGALVLGLQACAPASTKKAPTAASRTGGQASSAAFASKAPPVARAIDPDASSGPCGGYAFDGVTIGMPTADLERVVVLTPVPPKDTLIPGFEGHTFAFRATGPRRVDDVQVGLGPKATVEFVRASVLVTSGNAWPKSLFTALGEPKHARYSEWVWFDTRCGITLRLSHLEPLGADEDAQGYTVEVKRTLGRIPDPD